jgi:hypothetical protein
MEVKIVDLRAKPEAENTFSGVGAIRYRLQGVLSTKQGLSAPLTIGSLMSRPVPGTGCRGDWEYGVRTNLKGPGPGPGLGQPENGAR